MIAWFEPGQDEPTVLSNPAQVDALFDRMVTEAADAGVSVIAQVERGDAAGRAVLQLGVGGDRGFVGVVDADGSVMSTNGARSGDPVAYDYMGHEREVSSADEIGLADVREALRAFVRTNGERPTGVEWRPV
ncbi:Imm1 family immunity protein [Amycolatopsis sp. CA-128772]|uniref:Imm1 family immunity protein n=1 Tax=Amycolatopsis sp. CA-128772 TaxID=2073159 RepID=UPI001E5A0241|nr:Imm1 family immunity protein [Amycolatopsis sp. CA-128772]